MESGSRASRIPHPFMMLGDATGHCHADSWESCESSFSGRENSLSTSEWGPILLEALIRHLISGDAFFTGIGLILLAAIWRGGRWWGHHPLTTFFTLCGALLILFSATPLPTLVMGILATITGIWLMMTVPRDRPVLHQESEEKKSEEPDTTSQQPRPQHVALTLLMVSGWIAAGLYESTWCQFPRLPPSGLDRLIILGDSVTAGLGENEAVTWPRLLVRDHHMEILDLSRLGETVGSAHQRIQRLDLPQGIVIIELGGNDILGTTTVKEFRIQLESLLQYVSRSSLQIVMFEIPLPPLGNRFGQVQRQLARKYHVHLIPKEVLADVLLSPETTLDSIHLTQAGHDRLAEVIWRIIRL